MARFSLVRTCAPSRNSLLLNGELLKNIEPFHLSYTILQMADWPVNTLAGYLTHGLVSGLTGQSPKYLINILNDQ